jgi:hypothetical protein
LFWGTISDRPGAVIGKLLLLFTKIVPYNNKRHHDMRKMTKGPSLTAGRGKITKTKMASTPQPQIEQGKRQDPFLRKNLAKASFDKPR